MNVCFLFIYVSHVNQIYIYIKILFNISTAYAVGIHIFKVNERNIRTSCYMCSTLTLKTRMTSRTALVCLCLLLTNFATFYFVYILDFLDFLDISNRVNIVQLCKCIFSIYNKEKYIC